MTSLNRNPGRSTPNQEPENNRQARAPLAKKPRLTSASFTRRKRAVAACNFCRLRKTKCDTVKPVCGFCRHQNAKCEYTDLDEDDCGYDESYHRHEEILKRFDEIRSLLQNHGSSQLAGPGLVQPPRPHDTPTAISHSGTAASPFTSPASASPHEMSYVETRCESLLRWPIFEGVISDKEARIGSFAVSPHDPRARRTSTLPQTPLMGITPGVIDGSVLLRPAVQEEALVPLCQRFLAHVHPRNPILEPDELMAYAKAAADNGLGWDAPSCLVLIACALACYTQPWIQPPYTPTANGERDPKFPDISTGDEYGSVAEAYYMAAKKRMSLLETSLVSMQCLFFACIYEKYVFRPAQAWMCVRRAASCLQIYHLSHGTASLDSASTWETSGPTSYHLEQRLFWSLFKAESELAPELGIRPSIPADFDYPDAFPSPPAVLTLDPEQENGNDSVRRTDVIQRAEEERSWFFYLAEISLRRTIDDMRSLFYGRGERYWIQNPNLLVRQFHESEKQISLWYSHLPSPLKFDAVQYPSNELAFYLQGRFEDWRECISRPLLYCYLHHPPDQPPNTQVISIARQEVSLCTRVILRSMHHHRHGGTWFVCRSSFRSAVLLLAVVVKNADVRPPVNWWELVRLSIMTLERWSVGVADMGRMKGVLESLLDAVSKSVRRT